MIQRITEMGAAFYSKSFGQDTVGTFRTHRYFALPRYLLLLP